MKKPKFSLVIAVAPWRDAEIISSINKLNYPKDQFEVIIKKGPKAQDNRNNGVKASKGEIILFLDDDGIIESDFLKKVDSFFKRYPQVDILGGPQITPNTDKTFARVSGYAMSTKLGAGGASKRYKRNNLTLDADSNYISGALMICKRKVFKKLEFNRNIYPGDDTNFIESAKNKGFVVAFDPDIFIYHRRRADLKGYIKQVGTFAYTRSSVKLIREKFTSPFFYIPSMFLIYLAVLPTLLFISKLFLIPLITYVILILSVSIIETIKNKDSSAILILPWLFFLTHIVYGTMFIYGYIISISNLK